MQISGVRDRLTAAAQSASSKLDPELGRYAPIKRFLREAVPDDLHRLDPEKYVPDPVPFGTGVDFREDAQIELLRSWNGRFGDLYAEIRGDPDINTLALGRDHLHNVHYPTPDAEVYAAMIATRQPRTIIEIGAGFSTRIARRTIDALGLPTTIVVVDPQPRTGVRDCVDTLIQQRIEDVDIESLGIDGTTLFFIDSSHIVRAAGDIPLIFCTLLPKLPAGALVHVHDVFLPYDYPESYRRRLYGEAYVLWALLARSPSFRVLFATHFMTRSRGELMREVFGSIVGADERYYGASFWFDVV